MEKKSIKKARIDWVDWLKGLAIIFVVIGHFPINPKLKIYLYSFHLPMFFVLSGITFNVSKYKHIKEFIKHKAKGILLPYLFLNFSYLSFWILFSHSIEKTSISFLTLLKGLFIGNADKVYILNGPTWFLPTLFLVELSAYIIIKLFKDNNKDLFLFSCFSLLLGYSMSMYHPKVRIMWNLNGIPVALFIFMLGYLFSRVYKKNKNWRNIVDNAKIYYGIIFIIIGIIVSLKNGRVSFGGGVYKYMLYTIIAILFNISGYFIVINKLCKINLIGKIMSYIEKNTLFILGFHKAILILLVCFNVQLVYNHWLAIGFALIAVLITTLISIFVNRFCPFVIGKLEKTKSNYISFAIYTIITIFILFKYYL